MTSPATHVGRPPARRRHHPHPVHRRRPAGEQRASRCARWARRPWPTCCGRASCTTRPRDPDWFDRDRFVLSAGHASMLLYSLLHLTGYDLPLDELKRFRQLGSRTPGHPEYGLTPGVEATTGPLGQGFANAVGMAIAERRLAAEFNRPGHDIIDHWTYGICSDGDLQEGIASEAASLAGPPAAGQAGVPVRRQRHPARRARRRWPGRRTSSRASTPTAGTPSGSRTATTSTPSRRPSTAARADDRPSLIAVRTHIGYGSPNQAGHPEGPRRAAGSRRGPPDQGGLRLGSRPDVLHPGRRARATSGRRCPRASGWPRTGTTRFDAYAAAHPRAWPPSCAGASRASCPPAGTRTCRSYADGADGAGHAQRLAGRAPGAQGARAGAVRGRRGPVREQPHRPQGRAASCPRRRAGRNIRFGVREHAMGGIANGIAYHGGLPAVRRDVPDLQRLHARLGPPGGALAGCTWCTSGRTTRSASARTARPTSRSSTTPRCAPCPT